MGNAASNKAAANEPLEIPELIRQSSKSKLEDCSICLEPHRKGILCSTKEHFICQDCFAPYVSSVVEDAGKMQDSGFTIQCCYPKCASQPWSSHEARLALDGTPKVLEQYMDALVHQLKLHSRQDAMAQADMGEESVDRGLRSIVDALTLGCPFCHVALDPTPDGCAAMRCDSCSKYFCFLCFDIQRNNSDCHNHVRQCPSNPSHNVFPPQKTRDAAQKQLRVEAVRKALRSTYGLHWRQHAHTAVLLDQAEAVLRDSFISQAEVLGGGEDAAPAPAPTLAGGVETPPNSVVMFLSGFVVALVFMLMWQWSAVAAAGNASQAVQEELVLGSGVTRRDSSSGSGVFFWIISSIYWLFWLLKHSFFGFCYMCMAKEAVAATPNLARLPDPTKLGIIALGTFLCFYLSLFDVCWYIVSSIVQFCGNCVMFVVNLIVSLLKLMLPLAIIGGLCLLFKKP